MGGRFLFKNNNQLLETENMDQATREADEEESAVTDEGETKDAIHDGAQAECQTNEADLQDATTVQDKKKQDRAIKWSEQTNRFRLGAWQQGKDPFDRQLL